MAPRDFQFIPEISEMSDYYTNFAGRQSDEDIYTDSEDDAERNFSSIEEDIFESDIGSDSENEHSLVNEQAEQARGATDGNIVNNYNTISRVWIEQREHYVDYKMNEYKNKSTQDVSEETLCAIRLQHFQEFTHFAEAEWFRGSFFIRSQMNDQENILSTGLSLDQISYMLRQPSQTWESYLKSLLGDRFNRRILPSELYTQ